MQRGYYEQLSIKDLYDHRDKGDNFYVYLVSPNDWHDLLNTKNTICVNIGITENN